MFGVPFDDLMPPNLATLDHPKTLEEAFDGGQFWEVVLDCPRTKDARISLLRVALMLCEQPFSTDGFHLEEYELKTEAERYGREYSEGGIEARKQ